MVRTKIKNKGMKNGQPNKKASRKSKESVKGASQQTSDVFQRFIDDNLFPLYPPQCKRGDDRSNNNSSSNSNSTIEPRPIDMDSFGAQTAFYTKPLKLVDQDVTMIRKPFPVVNESYDIKNGMFVGCSPRTVLAQQMPSNRNPYNDAVSDDDSYHSNHNTSSDGGSFGHTNNAASLNTTKPQDLYGNLPFAYDCHDNINVSSRGTRGSIAACPTSSCIDDSFLCNPLSANADAFDSEFYMVDGETLNNLERIIGSDRGEATNIIPY